VSLSYKKLQKNELEKLHVRLFMAAGLCIRRVVMLRSEQLLPNFLEKLEDELRELIRILKILGLLICVDRQRSAKLVAVGRKRANS